MQSWMDWSGALSSPPVRILRVAPERRTAVQEADSHAAAVWRRQSGGFGLLEQGGAGVLCADAAAGEGHLPSGICRGRGG